MLPCFPFAAANSFIVKNSTFLTRPSLLAAIVNESLYPSQDPIKAIKVGYLIQQDRVNWNR